MYRTGHLGVSLLTFAPVGYVVVKAGEPTLAFVTGALVLWLAMLPDVDHRIPGLSHRGVTHTLVFAVAVGAVFAGAVLAASRVTPVASAFVAFAFFAGFLAVFAHLLGDLLTPMGVPLLWPLSGRSYSVSVTRADNRVANAALFVLGVGATAAAAALSLGVV